MLMTNVSGIDLNLLPLLDALITEKHVTRAGERVGLSQPAASRGLARLRDLLDDPLLVRTGRRFDLTPRAQALRDPVRLALGLIESAVAPPDPFDPASARRTVRVLTEDYTELVLIAPLMSVLRDAPGVQVVVSGDYRLGLTEALVRGEVDLFVGPRGLDERFGAGIVAEHLLDDRLVCLMHRDRAPEGGVLTLEQYANLPHALIAPRKAVTGIVDDVLAAHGLSRRIACVVPHFLAAPFVVANSNLVLTVAERVARQFADLLPLTILEPPVEVPGFSMALFWHERDVQDPFMAWFRDQLLSVAAAV